MIVTGVVMIMFLSIDDWNAVPIESLEQRSSYVKMMAMATKAKRAERRTDALSRERIVAAAIEVLDSGGESALPLPHLAARLATGSGAIYWHVAGKNELLTAATDDGISPGALVE